MMEWDGLNSRHWLFTVLEAEKFMFKVLADSVLISSFSYKDVNLIPHCQDLNLSVPMTSWVVMGKILRDPFLRPPLMLINAQRPHPQILSTYDFGRAQILCLQHMYCTSEFTIHRTTIKQKTGVIDITRQTINSPMNSTMLALHFDSSAFPVDSYRLSADRMTC